MNDLNASVVACDYDCGDAFGFGQGFTLLGCEDMQHPSVPQLDPYYQFRVDKLEALLQFLAEPEGDGFYLFGPYGTGKTSLVTQTLARLNWPVQSITAWGRMELTDLIGGFRMTQKEPGQAPVMEFAYGPLPLAMKLGHVLLINEIDTVDPEQLVGLNDIIEGQPLLIPETNELIRPHPMFRVVANGNTALQGSASYVGTQIQNPAFADRFTPMQVGYMDPATEEGLIKSKYTDIDRNGYVSKMVRVANMIRKQFIDTSGTRSRDALSVTMSTRTLCRWAHRSIQNSPKPDPLRAGLDLALLNRCAATDHEAIRKIVEGVFGSQYSASWS